MPKRAKRTVLNSDCREFVVRLQEYFERECQNGGPLLPVTQVRNRVADALGIGRATVSRIMKEKYGTASINQPIEEDTEKKLSTPNKKRNKISSITGIDNFDAVAIRNHVNAYYRRGEHPTLRKLIVSLKKSDLFKGSLPSLATVLKKNGIAYRSATRKITMESTDITLARGNHLKRAKSCTDWEKAVFLDKTCPNVDHTVREALTEEIAQSATKVPEGKGQRLIITHVKATK